MFLRVEAVRAYDSQIFENTRHVRTWHWSVLCRTPRTFPHVENITSSLYRHTCDNRSIVDRRTNMYFAVRSAVVVAVTLVVTAAQVSTNRCVLMIVNGWPTTTGKSRPVKVDVTHILISVDAGVLRWTAQLMTNPRTSYYRVDFFRTRLCLSDFKQ